MNENPSYAASVAINPTSAISLLHPQAASAPHPATNDFQSSSLPHLGDFITNLIGDAHKLQRANAELERTKLLLREAEAKLASSSEESKSSPVDMQLDKTKQQLRQALRQAEDALKTEQKKNKELKAANVLLSDNLNSNRHLLDLKGSLSEAETKLKAAENREAIFEADLKKNNIALEQKNKVFRSRVLSYKAILERLEAKPSEYDPVCVEIANRSIFLDEGMRRDLKKLTTFKSTSRRRLMSLIRNSRRIFTVADSGIQRPQIFTGFSSTVFGMDM